MTYPNGEITYEEIMAAVHNLGTLLEAVGMVAGVMYNQDRTDAVLAHFKKGSLEAGVYDDTVHTMLVMAASWVRQMQDAATAASGVATEVEEFLQGGAGA